MFGLLAVPFPCCADYSITLNAGFHLIANQLTHPGRDGLGDNTVWVLFPDAPDNTTIYKYDQSLNGGTGGFRACNQAGEAMGWFPYDFPPLNPGEAFLIVFDPAFTSFPFTLNFTGQAPTNYVFPPPSPGYRFASRPSPGTGTFENIAGFPATACSQIAVYRLPDPSTAVSSSSWP